MAQWRIANRLGLAIAILAFCLVGYALTWPVRHRIGWPRFFLQWLGESLGLDVHIVGTPLRRDVLFVSNHLSWLDIIAFGGALRMAFISKNEVAQWPIVGMLARIGGTIFIDRESRRAAHGQVDQLGSALQRRRPIMLFPEGTTNDGITVFPFRPALFASVAPPPDGIRVQPVVIDYGSAAPNIAWTGDEPLGPNLKRALGRKGRLRVELRFLEPLPPSNDRKVLAGEAHARVAAALAASESGQPGL